MNPSVDNSSTVTVTDSGAVATPGPKLWPVLTALVLFPLVQYGLALQTTLVIVSLPAALTAYLLCVYLYRGVARVTYAGPLRLLIGVAAGAVFLAGLVAPRDQLVMGLVNTAMIPLAGVVVGWQMKRSSDLLRAYLLGMGAVILGGLIMYVPQWGLFMSLWQTIGEDSIAVLVNDMTSLGYHADAAAEYGEQLQRLWNGATRLIPALTIMSLVAQFSIGFLWLLLRFGPSGQAVSNLAPFSKWKVPFGLTPVLIVAILGRLFGGETLTLVADNLLLALSIYYCVGGLALAEHVLRRVKIPLVVKIMFYILLLLMGVIGYVILVLIGFVDSFADWRKVARDAIGLEKK